MITFLHKRFSVAAGPSRVFALAVLALLLPFGVKAAGIHDVAPTADDAPVMLDAANPEFGNFMAFDGNPNNRLVATIGAAGEAIYFGLAPEYNDDGDPYSSVLVSRYRFRVVRLEEGGGTTVVHGPFVIDNDNANVNSYEEAQYGVYDTSAEQDGQLIYVYRATEPGDYSIEIEDIAPEANGRTLIPFWDFTVADADDNAIEGRVWSRSWALRTPPVSGGDKPLCLWDRPFNGDFYSYTEDGFVSRIDFADAGFVGLSFDIAFNSTGPGTSGDIQADRMSIPNQNATASAAQHRIFLTLPDESLFPSGECGMVTTGSSFRCDGENTYCLDVAVTSPGQVEIVLDFNGDGDVDDDEMDVVLVADFTADMLEACVPWDGLRGDGTPVSGNDTVDIIINYAQGIQHWAAYDVEFMTEGFCVETVRPVCSDELNSSTLFWDDRNITEEPGTGVPMDNRTGADCNEVPRSWNNFELGPDQECDDIDDDITVGYGDKTTLNTWWFANSSVEVRARIPVVNVSVEGNLDLCSSDSTVLTVIDLADVGFTSVEWSGPGVEGAATDSVVIREAGEYCVTVMSDGGCVTTTCVMVVGAVGAEPGLQISGPDIGGPFGPGGMGMEPGDPICTETTAVTATADNASTFQLLDETGALIETAEGTEATFDVPVSGPMTYTVVATTEAGCSESTEFTLNGGAVNVALPDTTVSCLSQELILSAQNLNDQDTLTYSWAPAELFEEGTATTANPIFNGDAGLYEVTLTATNQFGCDTEETTTLFVIDENSALSFTFEIGCDGVSTTFTNTSTVGFGYLWLFGDGTTSTEENPFHVFPSVGDFDVTLTMVVDQECVDDANQTVTTNNGLDVDITGAGDGGGMGSCMGADTVITVVNNNPDDPLTYMWTANDIITGPLDGPSVSIDPPAEGSVDLMVMVSSASGCDSTLTITVSNAPFMPNMFPDTVRPCFAEAFTIMGGPAVDGYTYEYETGQNLDLTDPANPIGNFTEDTSIDVTITDPATGCSDTQTIAVDVAPEIALMSSPPDTTLCEPGMVDLTASSVNENAEITWYNDADLTDVLTEENTATVNIEAPGQSVTVFAQAVDPATGCEQVLPVTVMVSDLSSSLPLTDVNACAGDDAPGLFAAGAFNETFQYTFDPSDAVDTDGDSPTFVGTEDADIMVTVTDPATGCTAMATVSATFRDLSGLDGTADPESINLGGSSTLTVTGCDDDDCTYSWMLPNGSIDPEDGPVVEATPDAVGDLMYDVEVTSGGCTESVTISLTVEDVVCNIDRVYVPNAFTPNGDMSNDRMQVRSNFADQITEFRFIIYDRWGQEVYASSDINESWDGRSEGDDLEPDVYGYWLRVVCPTGEELIQQGNISILR